MGPSSLRGRQRCVDATPRLCTQKLGKGQRSVLTAGVAQRHGAVLGCLTRKKQRVLFFFSAGAGCGAAVSGAAAGTGEVPVPGVRGETSAREPRRGVVITGLLRGGREASSAASSLDSTDERVQIKC